MPIIGIAKMSGLLLDTVAEQAGLSLTWSHNSEGRFCYDVAQTNIWATIWQNQQNECAPSEDSDQTGRMPSLISLCYALNG